MVDIESVAAKVIIPQDFDKIVILMSSSRQHSPVITPANTICLRRPVFEGRVFAVVKQAFMKLHPTEGGNDVGPNHLVSSPSLFTSPTSRLNCESFARKGDEKINIKILLVEDNRLVQHIAVKLLQKLGVDVDMAENGLQALDILLKQTYDAVLMDCQMPVMDGFEATKRIRQMEKEMQRPSTKIIALTAGVSEELKQECLRVGMDSYISKPVTLHMLRSTLGELKKGKVDDLTTDKNSHKQISEG